MGASRRGTRLGGGPAGRLGLATIAVSALLTLIGPLTGGGAPPAVAQSPNCPWMNAALGAEQRAHMLLSAMNIDQKIAMLSQAQPVWTHYGAAGYIPGQPGLCIPDLVLNDAGQGVGDQEVNTTAFPAPISQAASWDPALQRQFGAALGWEAWHKGINVQLAPGIETDRLPINGRNFEYMSEDPYLSGQGAVAEVSGIQSNPVIATVKHYIANSQETNRMSDSSDMDMRTLQEIYAPQYEAAVRQGHAGSVMCSYNRINGVYACENPTTLTKVLKQQFGFDGFVMSDWGGTHSTVPAANAGLDMEMNLSPGQYFTGPLKTAVQGGQVSMARLDDMVLRILRPMFAVGIFDHPAAAEPAAYGADVRRPEDIALARTISEDGTVMLKNDRGVLPLTGQNQKIAVIGPGAGAQGAALFYNGGGSGHIPEVAGKPDVVSPLQGITQRAGAQGDTVLYADGSSQADAIAAAKAADVAVVFVGAEDSEGTDRNTMSLASGNCNLLTGCAPEPVDQDALISQVAAANSNTIVVLNTGGPVTMPWLDQVRGLFEAWYPGQEDGNAIAALLFGDVDPSAKLTETFPKSQSDLPTRTPQQYPGTNDARGVPHSVYSEGLLVGYRWYDAKNIAPLFPFGFGLSYTSFDLRNLSVSAAPGGQTGANVSFDVVNTGARAGAEVPQLYVDDPPAAGEPPRQLKGFTKVPLNPGESRRVTLSLDSRSFAHWDTASGTWQVTPGCYGVDVGRSSRDLPLTATLAVGGASCPGAAASVPIVTVLPSRGAAACLSRRSILIHLFGVRARDVRTVTVFVNGRRRQELHGRRGAVTVTLRRLPRGVMRVRLLVSLGHGRSAVLTRTYRTCTVKHPHRLKRAKGKKKK
ncbi:MAG: beta-glucosidase [Solirubrobacteraceae bacterium]